MKKYNDFVEKSLELKNNSFIFASETTLFVEIF